MSEFVLDRRHALQLPDSYVDIDSEEMEYVDGGVLGNYCNKLEWFISDAINTMENKRSASADLCFYALFCFSSMSLTFISLVKELLSFSSSFILIYLIVS